MCTHQHFTRAGPFVLQEIGKCSVERCRSLSRFPGPMQSIQNMTLHYVLFSLFRGDLQKREIVPFDEEKALYNLAYPCMQTFWAWMCTVLLHKGHYFISFFLCYIAIVDMDLLTVNLATALWKYTWLFIFFFFSLKIKDFLIFWIKQFFWFLQKISGNIYFFIVFHNSIQFPQYTSKRWHMLKRNSLIGKNEIIIYLIESQQHYLCNQKQSLLVIQ